MEVYLHRLRALIASMAAALDGFDALVFTGGVGEHAPAIGSVRAPGSASSASSWTVKRTRARSPT